MVIRAIRLLLILLTGIVTTTNAQDQSNFTQFFVTPYLINASYAGMDGQSAMSLIYKKQWMNIDGGPTIGNFSLHTPLNPEMGAGISVTNDKKGIFNNSSLLGSFAYHLKLNKDHTYFRFGLSIGGTWNTVDHKKIEGVNDSKLASILDNNASLAGNAGISFQSKMFNLGVSMPTIFSPSYVSESAFSIREVKPFQNLIFSASNRFYMSNNKHLFEPFLIYRLNSGFPSQYEAAGVFHISHVVWLGASYKQDFGISGLAGIKIKNIVAIGGAFNLKNTGDNQLNSPGFEVSVNYLFGQHKKNVPVYSFVNAGEEKKIHHVSASHAIASKTPVTKTPVTKTPVTKTPVTKTPVTKTPVTKTDPVVVKTDPVKTEPVKTDPVTTPVTTTSTPVSEGHHEHEQEQLKRLETHAENPDEHHDGTVEHPHAERHEFVKRGDHAKELPVSDYVIGGVFGKEENAKHFSEGLDKMGFDTHYGHLTAKSLWYVYIIQTDDLEKARAARDKARKTKLLRDAWLLTVHH